MNLLFSPLAIRGLTLKNRVVISPMCQHSAEPGGVAGDWHLVHLGKFALGGAGLIIVESTAVTETARIGRRDVGLWDDHQILPFRRITDFVHANGAAIGVQLAHAGRKAGSEALWEGGRAFTAEQLDAPGVNIERIGPSAIPAGAHWSEPRATSRADIATAVAQFVAATRRAEASGFDCVELHFGHGYLVASFLSPDANRRTDEWGGSAGNRMRLAITIAREVRAVWPEAKPLFVRISAVDGGVSGWSLDDSVVLARALKDVGVDVIDCSSGGLVEETRQANVPRGPGFQVPYAARIRAEAGVMTQAVGVILDGAQAEVILQSGAADLTAIGREALVDPYWALHAARDLGLEADFAGWPLQHAGWLGKREAQLSKLPAR
jgi:2,4-dienoyl-CoA reductase-like NADH-dependent reductase (Old Yellow Enzyme family)